MVGGFETVSETKETANPGNGQPGTDSTTTTKTEEYVEDLYEDYEFDDNPNQGEEVTAKDKSYANAANFMYTVDKNPSDENVFFDHHEPNMLFNRFGGEPIGRIPIGLNDIYADYMDNRDSIPKEQETVIVTEPPLEIESKTSRKDWVAINLNDLRRPSHEKDKEISTKPPEHATKSATPTEATTVQSMESTVDKINREVHDMMLFKYIVYALLLILVILLLAFIIRIWHLLEYKPSNDFPPPATQYVKLPQPVTLPTVEDGTESLLP
ncbi:uncharacterized protein LOC116179991 [Photinus pyralis]|uniref:uncharacterized protein LOC116179991 n=1 Tax=Photinus pyralis TaxID=7054 RepID=UPI0012670C34|nr:uncharacterized protein LOC116179991 [Photinus pyralis]